MSLGVVTQSSRFVLLVLVDQDLPFFDMHD
jgi:hypothetical protein